MERPGNIRGEIKPQLDIFFVCVVSRESGDIRKHGSRRVVRFLNTEAACLHLGEIHHVAYHRKQSLAGAADIFRIPRDLFVPGLSQHHFIEAQHGVDRRAYLMRDSAQEFCLDLAGALCRRHGLLRLVTGVAEFLHGSLEHLEIRGLHRKHQHHQTDGYRKQRKQHVRENKLHNRSGDQYENIHGYRNALRTAEFSEIHDHHYTCNDYRSYRDHMYQKVKRTVNVSRLIK